MKWSHTRRVLGAAGLLLVLIMAFWPQVVYHAKADPITDSFTVNPTSGPPGSTVTLLPTSQPGDFHAGDPVLIVYAGSAGTQSTNTTNYTVNQDGTLPSMTFQIPTTEADTTVTFYVLVNSTTILLPSNGVNFNVTGIGGGTTLTPTPTGTIPTSTPTFSTSSNAFILNPTTAALGQPIQFSAGNFQPGETVTLNVQINGNYINPVTTPSSLVADSSGRISGTFTLPTNNQTIINNGSGANSGFSAAVKVTGTSSAATQTATLTVPPTQITAGNANITPGGTFTVSGGGFQSSETVTLTLTNSSNTLTNLGTAQAAANGTFGANFTAPTGNGVYTLKVVGQSSNLVATQSITIGQGLGITLSPVITTSGQAVVVKGFGFTPNVSVTLNGLVSSPGQNLVPLSFTTDLNGAFSATLYSTASGSPTSGVVTVTASDANGLHASAYLTLDNGQPATITASLTTASPGQAITVTGTNFAAGEIVSVALSPNVSPIAPIASTNTTTTVDTTRGFSITYYGPSNLANGQYLLVATGQASGRTAATAITLQGGLPGPTGTPTQGSGYVPFPSPPVPVASPTSPPTSIPTSTPTRVPSTPIVGATPLPGTGQITYFADGYTGLLATNKRATFQEALDIFNTTAVPAVVTVTYYVQANSSGATTRVVKTLTLGAFAAVSRSVNADAGNDKLLSISVQHPSGVIAQTSTTRVGPQGVTLDAAASGGSLQSATSWNFAEGYAGEEFQQYLSIFNPRPGAARVQVRFLPTSGAPSSPITYSIPANGRTSINVRAVYLGLAGPHAPKSIAIAVSSDQPIVVDRVLYWGSGVGSGKPGYETAPGISAGSTALLFPALPLIGSDEPYITVLNPGQVRANLQITFRDSGGHTLATVTNSVAPLARLTVPVRTVLRNSTGVVSALLTSSSPLVGEAPIYYNGSPNKGAHPGVALLGTSGATSAAVAGIGSGAATLYIFNPAGNAITVSQRFGGTSGSSGQSTFTVPPQSVITLALTRAAGPRGMLLTGSGPFSAAVINGGDGQLTASGGALLPPA